MAKGKNIKNMVVTAELKGGRADIRIVDYIGDWTDSSSRSIRAIVDEMLAQGVTKARVYVNSRGGDIFEAVEIANELSRFDEVEIVVGSVAASAATYIVSKFKNNSKAKSNSQLMIHRPSSYFSGDVVTAKARLKLLENTTNDYKKVYATATGKTEDEIEALWKNGDYWMTAEEAKEQGFIAEVIDEEVEVTEDDIVILEACGAPKIPQTRTTNKNSTEMDKTKIKVALGLPADATDEQIEAAAQTAKEKSEKLATVEANAATTAKLQAETLVNQAITDKKITADLKEQYVVMATANYDSVKAVFDKTEPLKKPETIPGNPEGDEAKVRASWTLEDYLDKAPEALAKMEQEDKERFDRLNKEYFNSKPEKK